jgi:hypothetical protein
MKISPEIIELHQKLRNIYRRRKAQIESESKIEVDEITSKVAVLYEKLRNTVDFKEMHLLRRFAIERNIKRRFIMETLKPNIARSLVEELIRARYLPNNTIPEETIKDVEKIIIKYNDLFLMMNEMYGGKEVQEYSDWLLGIEACEIDMLLYPEDIADAVIETMHQVTKSRVKMQGDDMHIREKNLQLYIAIHKSLVKSDDTIISYHLLNLYYDKWIGADEKLIKIVAGHLPEIYRTVQHQFNHPYQMKIYNSIREPVVTFKVLHELVLDKGEELENILADPETLESEAKLMIGKRYKTIRRRLRQSSVRAIIYLFITKVLLALVLEFPYELYALGHVNYINLAINVTFPPVLMFLVTLSLLPPSKQNTTEILKNIKNLVYNEPANSILCKLKSKYKKNIGYQVFYYLMYTALYVVVFGAIIGGLKRLEFNIISGAIFLFFLTAVSFFAIRIRNSAKEYIIVKRKEGFISFFVHFFSLPIIAVGRWLSTRFKKLNIFAFIMDFIIEAPFKMFVAAVEDWFSFIKEKREEVYHDKQ